MCAVVVCVRVRVSCAYRGKQERGEQEHSSTALWSKVALLPAGLLSHSVELLGNRSDTLGFAQAKPDSPNTYPRLSDTHRRARTHAHAQHTHTHTNATYSASLSTHRSPLQRDCGSVPGATAAVRGVGANEKSPTSSAGQQLAPSAVRHLYQHHARRLRPDVRSPGTRERLPVHAPPHDGRPS